MSHYQLTADLDLQLVVDCADHITDTLLLALHVIYPGPRRVWMGVLLKRAWTLTLVLLVRVPYDFAPLHVLIPVQLVTLPSRSAKVALHTTTRRSCGAGHLVKLNGAGAYHAAVHCATISAAKRLRGWSRRRIALSQAAAAAAAAANHESLSPADSPSTPPRSVGSASGGGGGLASVCSLSATEAAFAADLAARQC